MFCSGESDICATKNIYGVIDMVFVLIGIAKNT